jgi:hypothetical protein
MTDSITRGKLLKLHALLQSRKKKVAASVTLAGEVVEGVNLIVPAKQRSKFVEAAVRRELRRRLRRARAVHDLAILNARAERLGWETDDLVRLQADPFE